ncbi:MAG: GNAT family N-acetyltransferase [Crocinitomicaceae bacterium]|nr:GNAT family N-acetyltransferase [Crocinitomicaceae bacterium]
MEIREINGKETMLQNYELLTEVYPAITLEEYSNELDLMLPHNYGQVGMFDGEECIGMTGYWIGNKLWCGKYMELDNVVVSKNHRSKGIGEKLFTHMQDKAESLNCNMLALDSYSDNFKAHKFFYDQGYIPRGFHFINLINKDCMR